ncbi:MAG: hypothetical protein DRH57_06620 [Candidatus Cloacimonadota bacterium]|nr:MAG: hypothetical protein DRH57_06620 [Candidatus Cloacimonadota bacterium]
MQINQDTYKEGRLDFGMRSSPQRNAVYDYRHTIFNDLLLKDYPEYYLVLQGDRRSVARIINRMTIHTNFKYMSKLSSGLSYDSLESLGSNEFDTIARRFERFLNQHSTVTQELQKSFKR